MTPGELTALNEQAWSLATKEPAQGRTLANQAAAAARELDNGLELARALRTTGACDLNLGHHTAARTSLIEAVGLLQDTPEQAGVLAQTHRLLLRSYFLEQRHDLALRHGHQALEAARRAGDTDLEARTQNDIGLVFANLSAFEQALEYLLASIRLHEERGIPPSGSSLNNIGNIYMLRDEPERALVFFEQALGAIRDEGAGREEVIALGNIGRAQEALGELEQARRHHEEALQLVRSLQDVIYLAPTLTKLGRVLAALGERQEALACFEEALGHHEKYAGSFKYETLLALAELHTNTGAYEEAVELCRIVLETARESGERGLMSDAHHGAASALERAGRWQEALEHFKEHHALKVALDRELFSSQARALLLVYEVEQSKREQELLRSKNQALEAAYEELRALNAKLQQQTALLERLSLEDPLTGIHNRRSLEQRMRDEAARLKRYSGTFSVMMCDIDEFKRINDQHSHAVGDQILTRVGAILRGCTREVDVPARAGGDEFVVLFPATPLSDAVVVAENIRKAIEAYPWHELHPDIRVTVSAGVTEALEDASGDEVLAEADAQLYRAKHEGKNRVCYAARALSRQSSQ